MKSTLSARAISDPKAVVAVYNTHAEAEAGVRELQKGGFDTKKLSIVEDANPCPTPRQKQDCG